MSHRGDRSQATGRRLSFREPSCEAAAWIRRRECPDQGLFTVTSASIEAASAASTNAVTVAQDRYPASKCIAALSIMPALTHLGQFKRSELPPTATDSWLAVKPCGIGAG